MMTRKNQSVFRMPRALQTKGPAIGDLSLSWRGMSKIRQLTTNAVEIKYFE
jgi:hypothetical protein